MTVTEATDAFADFVAARPQTKKATCKMGDLLASLDGERRQATERALALDPKVQSTASIARVLSRWGKSINSDTVGTHRAQECACFRTGE